MTTTYKMLGKVSVIEIRGELPRVGDILVYPGEDGLARFRVREVQMFLQKTTSAGIYNVATPEVHVDLVD